MFSLLHGFIGQSVCRVPMLIALFASFLYLASSRKSSIDRVQADSYLALPEQRRLLRRLLLYGGMNDILQVKDFLNLTGASNHAKIRHIKIEINAHSVFLGYRGIP